LDLCTVITRNRLADARVLATTFLEHHAGARVHALCVDDAAHRLDSTGEPFDVVWLDELHLPEADAMVLRYEAFELANALKPAIVAHVLERRGPVVYLDVDMAVYAPLAPIEQALQDRQLVLTPHITSPLPDDGQEPTDRAFLVAGAYNGGCMGFAPGPIADRMLAWWHGHLRSESRVAPAEGLMVDQAWLDLAPTLFPEAHVVHDHGIDVAYWNLPERPLAPAENGWTAGGHPLRVFHFSGFDPRRPRRLSAYDARYAELSGDDPVAQLCADYARRLDDAGYTDARAIPYGYATTPSGIRVEGWLRALLDDDRAPRRWFDVAGEAEALAWWNAAADTGGERGVTRFLAALHASRQDLSTAFPDLDTHDGWRLREWALTHQRDERIPPALLPVGSDQDPPPAAEPRPPGLHDHEPGAPLPVARKEVVVCIPVYGAADLFVQSMHSVLEHTPPDVIVLVADDASPDPGIRSFLAKLDACGRLRHHVRYMRQPENLGFVGNVNSAFAATMPADVVILNSDCMVAAGWLPELRSAAYTDTNVATATALANHATILSVPHRNHPLPDFPQHIDFDRAAEAVRSLSQRSYPRIPTAIGHCVWVRRDALDLVGGFDDAFSPGYGEEVDFSQRCLLHGLVHVAADATLVRHRQGATFGNDGVPSPDRARHERILQQRYPYYDRLQRTAGTEQSGALPRALSSAGSALTGFSVTIDARILGPVVTGTQVHALELIGALSRTGELGIRVVVPPDLGEYARTALEGLDRVELLQAEQVAAGLARTAVAHRPFQVSSLTDFDYLRRTGERTVLTHQDLIAYRNPGYHPGYPAFERHRRITRMALTIADRIVFFSEHGARDALADQLVDPARTSVVHIGVDHVLIGRGESQVRPAGTERLDSAPFLLCLGTDFRHKNRLFAIRLLEALRAREGWQGALVLAGPRVADGSSAGDEAAFLAHRPELLEAVIGLPAVSEAEKAWLFAHAAGVVYPTLYEGFGLLPFEAAEYGLPCFFAPVASLAEILPRAAATLVPWDPEASSARVARILADATERTRLIELVRTRARLLTWDRTAAELTSVYRHALRAPFREAAAVAVDTLVAERERADLERKYNELWTALSEDAHALLGPQGELTPDEQRSLRAMLRRPLLRAPLVAALKVGSVARRRRREPPVEPSDPAVAERFALHFEYANREHMNEQLRGAARNGERPDST
jgi:GT2 family glycosyltransferase/glycosyltransferase involved in cell wall biosynthesis